MVVFNPPLGSHHTIPIPDNAGAKGHLSLNFTASFQDGPIGPDDKLELWTDAPTIAGDRSWRGVPFILLGQGEEKEALSSDLDSDRLDVLHISPSLSAEPTTDSIPLGTQFISLPLLVEEMSIEYTFRIIHPDGGISWLGGMGQNGTIGLVPQPQEGSDGVPRCTGWSGLGLNSLNDQLHLTTFPTISASNLKDSEYLFLYTSKSTLPPLAVWLDSPLPSGKDDYPLRIYATAESIGKELLGRNVTSPSSDWQVEELRTTQSNRSRAIITRHHTSSGSTSSVSEQLFIFSSPAAAGRAGSTYKVGIYDLAEKIFSQKPESERKGVVWDRASRTGTLFPKNREDDKGLDLVFDFPESTSARAHGLDILPLTAFGAHGYIGGLPSTLEAEGDNGENARVRGMEYFDEKRWEFVEEVEERVLELPDPTSESESESENEMEEEQAVIPPHTTNLNLDHAEKSIELPMSPRTDDLHEVQEEIPSTRSSLESSSSITTGESDYSSLHKLKPGQGSTSEPEETRKEEDKTMSPFWRTVWLLAAFFRGIWVRLFKSGQKNENDDKGDGTVLPSTDVEDEAAPIADETVSGLLIHDVTPIDEPRKVLPLAETTPLPEDEEQRTTTVPALERATKSRTRVQKEPVERIVKTLKTRTMVEPAFMKFFIDRGDKITLLSDIAQQIKVVRQDEKEEIVLTTKVEKELADGLKVIEIENVGGFIGGYELKLTIA